MMNILVWFVFVSYFIYNYYNVWERNFQTVAFLREMRRHNEWIT
jgi:hypothetical protein